MIISEDKLRRLIREQFLNEKDWGDTSSLGSGGSGSSGESYDKLFKKSEFKYAPTDDNSINSVDVNFRKIVSSIMNKLKEAGFDPVIGSGYRSPASQLEKIKKGYSKSKTIFGYHVALDEKGNKAARAVDLVDRKHGWSSTQEAFDFFEKLGEIANSSEFKDKITWGGNWKPKKKKIGNKVYTIGWDPAHIQTKEMSMKQSAEITKKGLEALKSKKSSGNSKEEKNKSWLTGKKKDNKSWFDVK